jgi:uncharacterized protein (DUF433 family)
VTTELPLFPDGGPSFDVLPHPHVVFDGSTPLIKETCVPVRRIWSFHRRGVPIATIMARYPQIRPGAILDALSFAYDNESFIEWDLRQDS